MSKGYNWMNCILHNLDKHTCMCFLSGGTLIKSIIYLNNSVKCIVAVVVISTNFVFVAVSRL